MIKIIVAGFRGSMGQKTLNLIKKTTDFKLVGVFSPDATDTDPTSYGLDTEVQVFNNLNVTPTKADVWVDFSTPAGVFDNAKFALKNHIRPVIGTSGLTDQQVTDLKTYAKEQNTAGLIVPNFGISAVLLMKFAKEAATYFPDVEIIEMHHEDKLDAPSGTALSTAKQISEVREANDAPKFKETLEGARGADYKGIRIHSVRLPGYVAHEQVLFGGQGEALTIRQDSFTRDSFMTGVAVAVHKVGALKELTVGLENVLS
ncbi:4-hydroxy-tetrahydrodipicolinate reductase [Pediococcus ethanolidurans]|uniref:4-hydroxy-tetrahydrodipicolinate reductase n=1 Tax=Pediococcus ethanolidurans TaxID=319653 RepID=A0A0R2K406_9LACO|nr:4-hydroxy-tetrahydrodipicolinate reductase [Pediococcus ethanolidurans]KRN81127.1 dihydrodipicolinate reductase [Pediococcus ethanolidurans]GEN96073.1 4-hydroxy-tetrahydrodipicolinate reductase [Pediococcus ethanolidurans]SER96534.1 dihydrodipicolinate reductase [Pediococcus ethanolidurans]